MALTIDELYDKFEKETLIKNLRNKPVVFNILLEKYQNELKNETKKSSQNQSTTTGTFTNNNTNSNNKTQNETAESILNKDPRERYRVDEKIGKGGFGFVYKAYDTVKEMVVAIKVINLEAVGEEMDDVQQEISIMSACQCAQLTQYYASYVVGW